MKIYGLSTVITFGKYNNLAVEYILNSNPSYLKWCQINLDHFHVSLDVFNIFCAKYPTLKTQDFINKWNEKEMIQAKEGPENHDNFEEEEDYTFDYGHSGEKYGWYNGWSDDVIDDAFEGDPENTWNVD
jgi:hypothetical protein